MSKKRPHHRASTPPAPLSSVKARQLAQQTPQDAQAWQKLGQALLQEKQHALAHEALLKALELGSASAEILLWLARTERELGQPELAIGHLQQLLNMTAEHAEANFDLAVLYDEKAEYAAALAHAEIAAQHAPHNLEIFQRKGLILNALNRYDEAREIFAWLTQKLPKEYSPWNNLGRILADMGHFDEAEDCFKRSIQLTNRQFTAPYSNYLTRLHYNPGRSKQEIFTACKEWEGFYSAGKRISALSIESNRQPQRKLRIGMFSDGFRNHPVGRMITAALEKLPRHELEIHAYTTNNHEDGLTQRIRSTCHAWSRIGHLSDEQFIAKLREDQIDILFDLCGHNAGTRMLAMLHKPAPLLVKWVGGLINTTGVSTFDYLLSDAIESPAGEDEFYTEKLIRMPDDYICYLPPEYAPEVSSLPALKNGYVTLGCFNNPTKINEPLLGEWAKLLHALPDSLLFLKGHQFSSEYLKERTLAVLEVHGISRERVLIEGPSPHAELLDAYNRVDISLDPWPYSGGLTTCEALLMGVPVVTMPGPTFAGRHSATHLVNAGMPELVTSNWDEYRARVIELVADLDSLSVIRHHLREVLLQSPVCDGPRFAKHLNTAIRAIWQRYCEEKTPAALQIDQDGQAFFDRESQPVQLQYPQSVAEEDDFRFSFEGKIITLDHGGLLVGDQSFPELQALGAFATIAFDPCSTLKNVERLQRNSELHHYSHVALGNGAEGTLYTCLDPAMTGTLEPLPTDQQLPNHQQGTQVLARLPITTLRLDDIEGLESIDWLLLDNLNDSLAILENGEKALANTLLVQVRVNFAPTHKNQPELTQISHWLSRHGFSFYRLNNLQHYSYLPISGNLLKTQATQLMTADAIFIPNKSRLASLNKNNSLKLGLILHTAYGIEDLTSKILEKDNESREKYLISGGYLNAPPLAYPQTVEEALHKLETCRTASNQGSHSLPGKLLVSLTSYKDRFENLHLTLRSLLCQNTRPDKTTLWIAENERDLLPQNVLELQKKGLEVRYCEDLRSYKKIIPALQEFPDWFIATADDDLYYNNDWLGELITAWNGDLRSIVAHRAHKIKLDKNGNPIKYRDWDWECRTDKNPDGLIMPTSGSGVLFPPGSLHKDSCLKDKFESLCADTDDIWLYWMASINGSKATLSNYNFKLIEWPQDKAKPLWHKNISEGNDKNIKLMVSHYGKPWEKNISEKSKEIHSTFTHKGRMVNFHLPNHEDHIQKTIKTARSFYELKMLEDIADRCDKDGSILDIGANIGNHTVFFGLFCKCKKIYAFEPQESVFKTLQENININKLEPKTQAFMLGLGETECYASPGDVDPKNLGMTKLNKGESGQIKIMPLEKLIDINEKISIIKIDVEGMEIDVLSGAKSLLKKQSPAIYAEAGTPEEFARLRSFLSDYGYTPKSRFNATATYLFEK